MKFYEIRQQILNQFGKILIDPSNRIWKVYDINSAKCEIFLIELTKEKCDPIIQKYHLFDQALDEYSELGII